MPINKGMDLEDTKNLPLWMLTSSVKTVIFDLSVGDQENLVNVKPINCIW